MDVPEKYRVSRFFQNTTDYKGERLTKKDVLRVLFLAFLIRGLIYFASVLIYLYLGLNYWVTGNAFQFTVYQKNHWYHTTTWFTNCVAEIMRYISGQVSNTTLLIWYPELILFVVAAALLLYSLRTQPLKYSAYLLVYTLINYSVTFLISGGRYMLNALPLFFFTAFLTGDAIY